MRMWQIKTLNQVIVFTQVLFSLQAKNKKKGQ